MDFLRKLLAYPGMNFASAPNAATAQQGGFDAGSGAGAGGASGGAGGNQPNNAGSGQPQGGQGGGDGIAQLRTAYESVKKEFEPFQKLNLKPEQITQYSSIYEKTYSQIASIGRQLGYPDNEIVEAMQEDPVATLDFLRNEFAQRQQGGGQHNDQNANLQQLVEQGIEAALAPINERENARMTNEANAVFERTTYQMASEMYKQEGVDISSVPEDEVSLLLSAASEILKYDEDALRALKYEGKTAPIQKAFVEAKTMLDKYYLARSQRSSGGQRAGAPGRAPNGQFQPGQQNGGKRPTLDEIIDNPGVINQKYA